MAQGNLGLSPDEFWTNPTRTERAIQLPLMERGEEALIVDAPPVVDLERRETVPVAVVRVATAENAARLPFREAAIVAAVDLLNNYTYAGLAYLPRDRGSDVPPATPFGSVPPVGQVGMTGESFLLDLRWLLRLPWKPTEYLVRLIMQDRTYDAVRIRLGSAPGGYHDPEVEKYLNELRKQPDVPALNPDPRERMRPFAPHPQAPAIPTEKGMTLSVRRVVRADDPDPVVLRCSFRLPVLRRHVVPPGADPWNPATAALFDQLGEHDTPPRGVVRIGLVMTGSVVPTPFVWRLAVPTTDPIPPGDGPHMVTGSFRVDLQTLGNVKGVEQTLFLYAFSDDVLVGPIPIGITAEPLIK